MTATLTRTNTRKVVKKWISDAIAGEHSQQRTESRHSFVRPATICRGGLEVRAMCRDISKHGIGLIQSDCPPQKGKHTISTWFGNRVMYSPVNIFWTRRIGTNWWASGGHLIISTADLLRLHWDRCKGNLKNRRAHERISFCHSFNSAKESDEANEEPDFGRLDDHAPSIVSMDISEGGMRLVSDEPFGFEETVIRLQKASDPDKGEVSCRIVSFFEMANGYYSTGVQFLG